MVLKLIGAVLIIFGAFFCVAYSFENIERSLKNVSALRTLI